MTQSYAAATGDRLDDIPGNVPHTGTAPFGAHMVALVSLAKVAAGDGPIQPPPAAADNDFEAAPEGQGTGPER